MGWLSGLFNKATSNSLLIPNYQSMASDYKIIDSKLADLKALCSKIIQNQARYESIEKQLGVPWKLIAAIHYREADLDFNTCLHNGDPLPGPTRHVPANRGPFNSWEEAAIDSLKFDSVDKHTDWSLPNILSIAEAYNGLGYRKHGVYSPYVWASTNYYNSGLYTSDGSFSSSKKDNRFGVAAIIAEL